MSRKSYQKVTFSVELTLAPGRKVGEAEEALKKLLTEVQKQTDAAAPLVKILRRETIYTN